MKFDETLNLDYYICINGNNEVLCKDQQHYYWAPLYDKMTLLYAIPFKNKEELKQISNKSDIVVKISNFIKVSSQFTFMIEDMDEELKLNSILEKLSNKEQEYLNKLLKNEKS